MIAYLMQLRIFALAVDSLSTFSTVLLTKTLYNKILDILQSLDLLLITLLLLQYVIKQIHFSFFNQQLCKQKTVYSLPVLTERVFSRGLVQK